MPATRSGGPSRQSRSGSGLAMAAKTSRKVASTVIDPDDIINLASSSSSSSAGAMYPHLAHSVAHVGGNHAHHPSRAKSSSRRPPVSAAEVIEISSDDDESPPPRRTPVASSSSAVSELRKQVRKLREEKDRFKQEAQALHNQVDSQRQKIRALEIQNTLGGGKVALDEVELEDIVSCNICTNIMFTPYILSGCGHTFCQKCLMEWFDATLRNFITTYPHYNPNQLFQPAVAHQIAGLLANPLALNDPRIAAYIQAQMLPRPHYTCPECRAAVKSPPIENFSMKSLSRLVTAAKKEPIPNIPLRPREGLWDGYFPSVLRR